MAQTKSSKAPPNSQKANRSISIGGDVVNSQVVVGDNNNIYVTQSNQRPNVSRLAAPILVGRPPGAVDILGREVERKAVQTALDAKSPVEIYSTEGFGKTTLARYLSSRMQLTDGMVLLSSRAKSFDDIYFELFTAFYKSDQVYKPSQVEYLRYFADLQALIILDDIGLTRDEVQTLLSALPGCVFILSSTERHLWDKGDVIHLAGLPPEIAVDLFENRVGRALSEVEKSLAGKICIDLKNNPLHIIQAAAAVRDDGKTIDALAQELQAPSAEKVLYDQILSALPDSKKQALALLAVMGGAPLPEEHMVKMLNSQNFSQLIGGLLQEGLALAHSPRYSVADGLRNYLIASWDLSEWKNATLQYFVNWTAGGISRDQILNSAEVLFALLGNAAADGRWQELLNIGKAIESAFLFSGQWGAWTRLLNLLLQASRALGDRFTEAWVLHQLGSRALCLRDLTVAKDLLSQALNIRRVIGDRVGVAATQHNLGLVAGGPPPNKPPHSNGGAAPRGGWWLLILVTIGLIGILVVGAIWALSINPFAPIKTFTPSLTLTLTQTIMLTPSVTLTEKATYTPISIPSPTPTNTPTPVGRIVFQTQLDRTSSTIYAIYTDGSDQHSITPDYTNASQPAWSSDGKLLAFVSTYNQNSSHQIYVMNADGSNLQQVSIGEGENFHPTWSPDGRQIAYLHIYPKGNSDIFAMDADGNNVVNLTNFDGFGRFDYPEWAPDGKHIAYQAWDNNWEIFVMETDGVHGFNQTELTHGLKPELWSIQPSWSPKGDRLVFTSNRTGAYNLYLMNVDGSGIEQLTKESENNNLFPDWSPDGRLIVFSSSRDGNLQIYIMTIDGSRVKRLTKTPGDSTEAEWRP